MPENYKVANPNSETPTFDVQLYDGAYLLIPKMIMMIIKTFGEILLVSILPNSNQILKKL